MRKPFSLEEYRSNPEQKIVTRNGRSVEILYTDRLSERCVIALVDGTDALYYYANGRGNGSQGEDNEDDLFFVTPEEDRTPEQEFEIVLGTFAEEFELAVTDYKSKEYKNCNGNLQLIIKKYVPKLLKVAKKTYQGEIHNEVQRSINNAWEEGREYGEKELVEKACTWLKENLSVFAKKDINFWVNDFKECMETL